MITVKFFGLISVDYNIRQILVKEGSVKQALEEIRKNCPHIPEQHLMKALLFVNKHHLSGNKRLFVILKDGDELALINPSSGG